jgi:hypothetical protein
MTTFQTRSTSVTRLDISTTTSANVVVSRVVWKKRNGAFFRLVKCTTQPAALAGGHPEERAMGESIREVERAQEHELVPSAT